MMLVAATLFALLTLEQSTPFGKLTKAECGPQTSVTMIYIRPKGHDTKLEKRTAEEGHVFVTLHFTGKLIEGVDLVPAIDAEEIRFLRDLGVKSMVRSTDQAWLTASNGKKYDKSYVSGNSLKRQIAWEVPKDAAGLTLHGAGKEWLFDGIAVCGEK